MRVQQAGKSAVWQTDRKSLANMQTFGGREETRHEGKEPGRQSRWTHTLRLAGWGA